MLARSPLEKSMSHYLIAQLGELANVEVRTGAVAVGRRGRGRAPERAAHPRRRRRP
jgi:hypothetical protein